MNDYKELVKYLREEAEAVQAIQTPSYEQLSGLKPSTLQLFDALVISLTESGAKTPTVILSLTDYMKRRGLKDRKEARKQFTDDLLVLQGINITLEEAGANGSLPIKGIKITDSWEWADKKKTAISYTFGTKFYKILLGYGKCEQRECNRDLEQEGR